jgi:hypothetical protein
MANRGILAGVMIKIYFADAFPNRGLLRDTIEPLRETILWLERRLADKNFQPWRIPCWPQSPRATIHFALEESETLVPSVEPFGRVAVL